MEDVPTGLVPISYLGRLAGVETPAIDAMINMACQLYDYDFWSSGRNLGSLGLEGLNPSEVREYVRTGVIPEKYPEEYSELHEIPEVEIPEVFELEVDKI